MGAMSVRTLARTAVIVLAMAGVPQASAAWADDSGSGVYATLPSEQGKTVLYQCRSIGQDSIPGLIGGLVLGSENPLDSLGCTPTGDSSH